MSSPPRCNENDLSYENVMNCFCEAFVTRFVSLFNTGPGQCSSDNYISQSFFLDNRGDLSDCKVKISQYIDYSGKQTCANINEILNRFQGVDRERVITQSVNEALTTLPDSVRRNTGFIGILRMMMIDQLSVPQTLSDSSCSQTIQLTQDQRVLITDKVICHNSLFDFSQSAIVENYIRCLVEPYLENLKTNLRLRVLYQNIPSNNDCIYDWDVVEPCNGTTRKVKYSIIKPATGNGKCAVKEGDMGDLPCTIAECEVADWEPWSDCINGKQTRKRVVLNTGQNCPSLSETRFCQSATPFPVSSVVQKRIKEAVESAPVPFQWLKGPSYWTSREYYILGVIVFLFLGALRFMMVPS
jgi:hypothetical protein